MKQTSDRESAAASRVMRGLGSPRTSRVELVVLNRHGQIMWRKTITGDVRAIAASCLVQDETKGKRKKVRK